MCSTGDKDEDSETVMTVMKTDSEGGNWCKEDL